MFGSCHGKNLSFQSKCGGGVFEINGITEHERSETGNKTEEKQD
jgi:hypothetical protein